MKKAKAQHVAKPAKPAQPPRPAVQKLQHQVAVLQRQVASLKHPHHATSKHTHHGKKAAGKKHAVKRGWSPDSDVALCSARAVAESLRLALGIRLSDEDVLGLHWAAGGDPDAGATILATLDAAQRMGTGSALPLSYRAVLKPAPGIEPGILSPLPIILGLDLPWGEPHAVAVDLDGIWWSWGEPYQDTDFPGAVIEEAWAVQWQ